MRLENLHSDEELRLREFPVAREKVFVAHGGVCPIPNRVATAIEGYARHSTMGDQETLAPAFAMNRTRELAARLIGAETGEVALVGPTSLALSLVAGGLEFEAGDNVIACMDDYPSNVYPWMALRDKGVEVRFVETRAFGAIQPEDVFKLVDERTRLAALASCHYATGFRLDHETIGRELRKRGVLFCLDAIQTVGALPTTVEQVDFLAADSHKWMLGPCAAGILYVRREVQERLRPPLHGWHNIECPDFVAQEELKFKPDARRYEVGSANLLGLVGFHAALELIHEVGVGDIAAELLRKRNWLAPVLADMGYEVMHRDASEMNCSGVVTVQRPGADMDALHARLAENNVMASVRSDREGRKYLRFSPHYYNTDAEMNRMLELL